MHKKTNHQNYNTAFFKKWAPFYDYMTFMIGALRDKAATKINPNNKHILDVACGTGAQAIALAKKGFNVIGLDSSKNMLQYAQQKIKPSLKLKFIKDNAVKLNFTTNTFDATSISLSLHDMPQKVALTVLTEMKRVTKPNGQILIVEYNTPQNWFGYHLVSLFESKYYQTFIKLGLNYFLKKVGLFPLSKDVFLLNNFQILVCQNKK